MSAAVRKKGEDWCVLVHKRLNRPLPHTDVGSLAVDPQNPNTVYAGIGTWHGKDDAGLYKSTDGGANWRRTVQP